MAQRRKGQEEFIYWALIGCLVNNGVTSYQALGHVPLQPTASATAVLVSAVVGRRRQSRCRATNRPKVNTALGDLLQEGVVAKLADDLYCGGNSPQELLDNWSRVLDALDLCNLRLSAKKTRVCPKTTTILGWVWTQGTLHASPHRIATLSSCVYPQTVLGLRSFIGAYKVLGRVIPQCSKVLAPLESCIEGRKSQDVLHWSDNTREAFRVAQNTLSTNSRSQP